MTREWLPLERIVSLTNLDDRGNLIAVTSAGFLVQLFWNGSKVNYIQDFIITTDNKEEETK